MLKRVAPAQRYSEPGLRSRVHVRCVCGHEQDVFESDLRSGKTGGCKTGACSARWHAAEQLRAEFRDMVTDMRTRLEAMLERYLAQD